MNQWQHDCWLDWVQLFSLVIKELRHGICSRKHLHELVLIGVCGQLFNLDLLDSLFDYPKVA